MENPLFSDAELLLAVFHRAARIEKLRAVGEGPFNAVAVEVLVVELAAEMPAAGRLGLHRPGVLHPADLVHVVHVEVAEHAAAGPEEAVEPLGLPEEFAHALGRAGIEVHRLHRSMFAVAVEGDQVARLAVVQPVEELAAGLAMAAHQPHADLEVFGVGLGSQFDDPLRARAVDRDWLFQKRVDALLDGIRKVRRAKADRCCEDSDVAGTEAVDRSLVGVDADVLFLKTIIPSRKMTRRYLGDKR